MDLRWRRQRDISPYAEVDVIGELDVGSSPVVKTSSGTRRVVLGAFGWLGPETLDGLDVVETVFLRKRSPGQIGEHIHVAIVLRERWLYHS